VRREQNQISLAPTKHYVIILHTHTCVEVPSGETGGGFADRPAGCIILCDWKSSSAPKEPEEDQAKKYIGGGKSISAVPMLEKAEIIWKLKKPLHPGGGNSQIFPWGGGPFTNKGSERGERKGNIMGLTGKPLDSVRGTEGL